MSNEIISFQTSNIENIKDIIYEIRGQKVMLDNDLAEMYEVEVASLNGKCAAILIVSLKISCLS